VGAVALLHALADKGEGHILAMMVSSGDPWGASCLDALNTYFGRPDIPIGNVSGKRVVHRSKYTQKISSEFQHDSETPRAGRDAVSLYRKILAADEDRSVVIVSVGYLTNLSNLISSSSDRFSSLDGMTLVRKKVKATICMGGKYPSGREWNFYQNASDARNVIDRWPGPITFIGYETGVKILTGAGLKETPMNNPVRRSYELYNNLKDRPSWDQMAVLYAVKRAKDTYAQHWYGIPGRNCVLSDGTNEWVDIAEGPHSYLRLNRSPETYAVMIEKLMISPIHDRSN